MVYMANLIFMVVLSPLVSESAVFKIEPCVNDWPDNKPLNITCKYVSGEVRGNVEIQRGHWGILVCNSQMSNCFSMNERTYKFVNMAPNSVTVEIQHFERTVDDGVWSCIDLTGAKTKCLIQNIDHKNFWIRSYTMRPHIGNPYKMVCNTNVRSRLGIYWDANGDRFIMRQGKGNACDSFYQLYAPKEYTYYCNKGKSYTLIIPFLAYRHEGKWLCMNTSFGSVAFPLRLTVKRGRGWSG